MGFLTSVQTASHYNLLNDCYVNICRFTMKKYGKFYLLTITYNIYMNYEHRLDEKIPLYEKSTVISIDTIPEGNIMNFLYDELKKVFDNTIDQ